MPTISTYIDLFGRLQPLAYVAETTLVYPDLENLRRSKALIGSIDLLMEALELRTVPRTHVRHEIDPVAGDIPPDLEAHVHRPLSTPERSRTQHLLDSVADLQTWLGVGLRTVADAAGIDRGTVYAWRREPNTDPHQGTTGSILRMHNLVASAVDAVGPEGARTWFHSGDPSPIARLIASHGDPKTLGQIGRLLRHEFVAAEPPAPNPRLAASVEDLTKDRSLYSPWE